MTQPEGLKNRRQSIAVRYVGFLLLALGSCLSAQALDQFGDVSVDASAIYTGNTYHGYAETRVMLENHSHEKSHLVTLVYPDKSYAGFANWIGRLSRTVTIAPDTRQIVSLLQPPLNAPGDGSIGIEVDGDHEGQVHAPNANSHCNYQWRGMAQSAAVFISRGLNFDAVDRVFKANRLPFTAAMATGAPDAGGVQNTWMPDGRYRGGPTWLELDYAKPQTVDKIVVHLGMASYLSGGDVELIGVSRTNVTTIPIHVTVSSWKMTFTCPLTAEPIKTVRLNFTGTKTGGLSVDAVQISGPSGTQWASDARASSDNSAAYAGYRGPNADSVESLRAESPVSEWSDNWLGYSPFDCVVLGSTDFASMPPAVLGALGDYLAAGGFVILSGMTNLPAAWRPWHKATLGGGEDYRVGFGRCLAFPSDTFSGFDSATLRTLHQEARDRLLYWQSLPGDSRVANSILPVVATLKVPTRGIVIIMLAFIILIGPVNIFLLSRARRRTWMLWTIPAISLLTTLFVFVYSLLREGITPDTRIAGMTLLDQESHHAATIGGTAFYCPLTPSSGLHFEFGTEATPLVQESRSGTAREVDWTQFQQFRRGWLASRVPAYFHLRKSETRRERIQLIEEGGKLQIVNGLGAPIRSLWLASENEIYEAENVAAGEKAGLTGAKEKVNAVKPAAGAEERGGQGLWHKIGFGAQTNALKEEAAKFLLPNTYIAVLEGNPFIENALGSSSSPKRTTSSSIVFGFLEPTAGP